MPDDVFFIVEIVFITIFATYVAYGGRVESVARCILINTSTHKNSFHTCVLYYFVFGEQMTGLCLFEFFGM